MDNRPSSDLHYLFLLGAGVTGALLLYLLSPILAPFLFAAILAYICDPLVNWLQARKLPRTAGTLIVLVLLVALLALLVMILLPLVVREGATLIERVPAWFERLDSELLPWLKEWTGMQITLDVASLKRFAADLLQNSEGLIQRVASSAAIGGMAVVGFIVNLLLVPVVLFYLLRDWNVLLERIDALIPRRWHQRVGALARDIDRVLAEFLRGQLAVIAIMSVYFVVALWLVGLEFALPIGVITGVLVFVPYLGATVGFVLATLTALMQFGSLAAMAPVWIVIVIGQVFESMVVTPWLVGDRIGLHPVAVIFALLAFGQVFGFFGILLALPASAALLVWLRYLRNDYLESRVYRS